ncbi:prepilin-type N-terminal cleavage/methylation domain-containing protein [Polynucleobacter paneuropaeus]|nr:prepilin-type N-terminal cleavage/methylation domain-containing protein [Polynucleobacter paneuropaeus]
MQILAIGSKRIKTSCTPLLIKRVPVAVNAVRKSDAGFTLIEMLVAIAVMAVILAVAVLAIPNHDDRYWRDNLDQLVSSLNLAQEESAMSGTPMIAQIDSGGWRFFIPNANGGVNASYGTSSMGQSGNAVALGGSANAPSPIVTNTSGLLPDVYKAHSWYKLVDMAPIKLTLGGEQVAQVLQIPIKQVNTQANGQVGAQAILMRNGNGLFSWTKL